MTLKSKLCTANEIEQMLLPLLVQEMVTARQKLELTTDPDEIKALSKEIDLLTHEINDMSPEPSLH